MLRKPYTFKFILILSLTAFLIKSISYARIGSYLPITVLVAILSTFFICRNKIKTLHVMVRIWALSLIFWSLIRAFFAIINYFVKPLTENHLHQQLGFIGTINSFIALCAGIYMLKNAKKNSADLSLIFKRHKQTK